ncbi:YPDG domain-containing protein, partial [Mammaliicoccus sciuri]|uniref:YPDG domain-containing protein n=4 Tax=Mammaliicoccus sciuri TaxID=1296 RepID=UPI001E387F59
MDKQRKLQKFSIRKYTVGTCSILIGTLIFLGLPTHDAFASENVIQKHAQEEKAEGKSTDPVEEAAAIEESSNVEETKEIGTAETTAEQPQEEATTEAPAVDETTQDATTNEESTTEDKSSTEKASTEEATQVDTVAPEIAKVENAEKAEQPKAESTEVAEESTSTEETTETAEPAVNTVDAVQPASVKETPAVDTPTVEATVTNTVSDVDTNSVSSKSLEDIVNNQNKDKVDATTLEQPSRQAPKSGESYGSVFRAAELQTRDVSNWEQYLAALNDKNVGTINFTADVTMPKPRRGAIGRKLDSIKVNNVPRNVTVNLNGHLLNTQDNYIELPANGKNQPAWNFTFTNGHIHTEDNPYGPATENYGFMYFDGNSHDHVINFRDIEHTGSTLINNEKIKVNISGQFTSNNEGKSGKDRNATIGGNEIRVANDSVLNMTMTTKGRMFKVHADSSKNQKRQKNNGLLSFGDRVNATLSTDSTDPWDEDNAHTIFKTEGGGTKITFGNNSTITLIGQDIFAFGSHTRNSGDADDYGLLDTGRDNHITVTQKGNGNIVNMHGGSEFIVGPNTEFNATSFGKLNGGPRENNLIGLNSNSEFRVEDSGTFKLVTTSHGVDPKTGKHAGRNPAITMPTSGATKNQIVLKNNSTFDVQFDNPEWHSEIIGFTNVGGGNTERGVIIEGTVKYLNLQRTRTVTSGDAGNGNKLTDNVSILHGDTSKINVLKWSGNHEVRTWDARVFHENDTAIDDIDSNVTHIWDNVSNYYSKFKAQYTDKSSVTYNGDTTTPNSNRDKDNNKDISDLNIGKVQRFVLIGHDVTLGSTIPAPVKYQALPDETKPFKEETTVKEGKDGVATKYVNRQDGTEKIVYAVEDDKPKEKVVGINNIQINTEETPFNTIYRANPDKLTTEPEVVVQEGRNGEKRTKTTYDVDPETGELSNPQTDSTPISKTEKQDKIIEVGAKEVTPDVVVPYETETRENPNLKAGTENVVQDGMDGTKEVITIYNIDPATGERTTVASTSEHETKPATKKIVEIGTKTTSDSDDNNPNYGNEPVPTKPGKAVDVPQTGDTDLPPGTTYEIPEGSVPEGWTATVDPNTGVVTVTPPADATPGDKADIPVKVKYPDGSSDDTSVPVKVEKNDAQNNDPNYGNEPVPTKPGKAVDVPQTGDTDLPPGTTYEIPEGSVPEGWTATVDPNTGVVTVTPPADATPG